MMTDNERESITWSIRYVERGTRDDVGYVIPPGWYIAGWEENGDESIASIYIAQHAGGSFAAASLAAVAADLLNTYEKDRLAAKGAQS